MAQSRGPVRKVDLLYAALLILLFALPALGAPPIATGITGTTYTDANVAPGQHFYFVVACNAGTTVCSGPTNSVNVLVPAGQHNVVLNWTASPSPGVTYSVYRGAPPTAVKITNSN